MEFLQANTGTIVIGTIVFAGLGAVIARLIVNFRKGKTGCAGCSGCRYGCRRAGRDVERLPIQNDRI